jgi:hypothetical protein
MAPLNGDSGRLTAQNSGFWPGQISIFPATMYLLITGVCVASHEWLSHFHATLFVSHVDSLYSLMNHGSRRAVDAI